MSGWADTTGNDISVSSLLFVFIHFIFLLAATPQFPLGDLHSTYYYYDYISGIGVRMCVCVCVRL